MGDFVKGNQYQTYPSRIQVGILLHREIDSFTDQHEVVRQSKDHLKDKYRHYSGVLVDVFYDHFLALHFSDFSSETLDQFVSDKYALLMERKAELPERAQQMLPYMIRGNWLVNYQSFAGIHRSLSGMSRRTSFDSKMEQAIVDLQKHHEAFDQEFLAFFPEVVHHANNFREELLNSQR